MRQSHLIFAPPLLLLCACQRAERTDNRAPVPTTPTPTAPMDAPQTSPVTTLTQLKGEYRVAAIDGEEVEGAMGIALSIEGEALSYEPACRGFVWTMAMDTDGLLALNRDPRFGAQVGPDGASVSCLVAVPPSFMQLASALDQVDRAARTPANALVLRGNSRSVTLFSQ